MGCREVYIDYKAARIEFERTENYFSFRSVSFLFIFYNEIFKYKGSWLKINSML
jgi:hypothetical protein